MNPIDIYVQKIHSALAGGGVVKISSFSQEHAATRPVLHAKVLDTTPDIGALVYSLLRLPPEFITCSEILMGQSDRVFEHEGIDTHNWTKTQAVARARVCAYNTETQQLAFFVASITDVEDIITNATAISIEIQKLHTLLTAGTAFKDCFESPADYTKLTEALGTKTALEQFIALAQNPIDLEARLLAGSNVDYAKAVQEWWIQIASIRKTEQYDLYKQPVYFVSSNSHSLINVLSGYAQDNKQFLQLDNAQRLQQERAAFEEERVPEENILYYLSRFSEKRHPEFQEAKLEHEQEWGLHRMPPYHHIDIEAQVFSIKDLIDNPHLDSRLQLTDKQKATLRNSNALILNIAYPLGMGAYRILREVSSNVDSLRGVYIMGKAASLNGQLGDITIPHQVFDKHTNNHFFVYNDFHRGVFDPYIEKNSILDSQQAVTVRGTYLQNETSLTEDFAQGYSIIEMEAAPYLNAVYEMTHPMRYPEKAQVSINTDFRLGMAYYVSDTPHRTEATLGAKRLTWEGLNATYAISLGIVQDIFNTESQRYK
jgi:hypothetical protein